MATAQNGFYKQEMTDEEYYRMRQAQDDEYVKPKQEISDQEETATRNFVPGSRMQKTMRIAVKGHMTSKQISLSCSPMR